MREKILKLLEQDFSLEHRHIAAMLNTTEAAIDNEIDAMMNEGVILRAKPVINWEMTDREFVTAVIELNVTPQRGEGFDKVAQRIYQYPEVKDLYLMSGGYDLMVTIEGKTLKEVAMFVSEKLAPMDCVTSTRTHFILKKYKQVGIIFEKPRKDERSVITL